MHVPGVLELLTILALCVVAFEAARIGWYLTVSKRLTRSICAFELLNKNAKQRVLVIGDSTGYGTGTNDPKFSISGRIAQEFPDIHLENRSKTGLKLHGLLRMFKKANHELPPGYFDLIVILCGGMNVVHRTPFFRMQRLLRGCLQEAVVLGRDVLLVTPHNPALPPMFRFPLSYINGMRGRKALRLFMETTRDENVQVVSVFGRPSDLIFERNLYAPDKVHPNDEGYGIWYAEMQPVLKEILTR